MVYPLPTEHERRALFWWLEQASSLTASRRLYSYHQRFVEAVRSVYEEEQCTVGMKQTIDVSWFASVLNGQDAFDAALDRLRAGDRRCFDFLGARGHFSQGLHPVEWWQDMFVRQDRFAPSMSPRWREIGEAMHDCLAARLDISLVLQDRSIDAPAPIGQVNLFMSSPFGSLMKLWLERTQLPAVPIANPEVLVATGQVVPCYGIWEPVQVAPTLLGKLFGSRPASPPPERPLDGCMNYLNGGSAAPTIQFEGGPPSGEGRPTTWRLIWRDDRYGANPIPPHEAKYVFVRPVKGEVVCTCW